MLDGRFSSFKAREQLVAIGGIAVTRALMIELNDPRRDVRWEAAKALVAIADTIAAPALVHHLSDEDGDIRWLAAEGLGGLGEPGLLLACRFIVGNISKKMHCHSSGPGAFVSPTLNFIMTPNLFFTYVPLGMKNLTQKAENQWASTGHCFGAKESES